MKLNKKRFVLGFACALIISALVFVVADSGYLINGVGSWVNYNNQQVISITLHDYELGGYPGGSPLFVTTCENSSDVCLPNGVPVGYYPNIVKAWMTGLNGHTGPIYFEVYETKYNNAIRTGSNKLNGNILYNGVGVAPWSISLQDIVASGTRTDNVYQFYYKAITPEGYERTYRDVLLNVTVLWSGNLPNPDWYDSRAMNIINSVNINASDLFGGTGNSNLVNIKAIDCTAPSGTPVVFQIFDNHGTPIRTGLDALVGVIDNNKIVVAPWAINYSDLSKSSVYDYSFTAAVGNLGAGFAKHLIVSVDYSGIMNGLLSGWFDYSSNPITSIAFNWNDLANSAPSQSNSVYANIQNFPAGMVEGMGNSNIVLEIWTQGKTPELDKPIRTVNLGNPLTGAIVDGRAKVLWKLTQADILNAGANDSNEFYYKVILGRDTMSFRDNPLQVNITGIQGIDISSAGGVWKDEMVINNITNVYWQPGVNVIPYSWNINAPQGTTITFEIWRENGNNDVPIRTVQGNNALTANVNGLGQTYALWTILQSDLTNATHDYFYFKIKYGSQEKSFSNVLLDVQKTQSTCINVNYCIDYMEQSNCNQDACGVANITGGNYNVNCSALGMNCGCSWDAGLSQCNFVFSNQNSSQNYGNCQYLESGNSSCQDGIINLLWTGSWGWATGNAFANQTDCENSCGIGNCTQDALGWHCDPQGLSTQCTGSSGSNTISCPARVQLSGFTWLNIVFIVIALVIIYFLIAWRRRVIKSRKKKGKRR